VPDDRARQRTGDGGAGFRVAIVEMAFACDTSDHHRFHAHEARPALADCADQGLETGMNFGENILMKKGWR
jgi:hypothetical protein